MALNTIWMYCLVYFATLSDFGCGREYHFGNCIMVVNGVCPDTKNIQTYLFTRMNPTKPQYVYFNSTSDNMTNSYYDPKRPNKLIIHGYNADMYLDSLVQIKAEYLKQDDYNIWTVNWPSLCQGPCYPFAVYNLGHVGECLSQLILALRRSVLTLDLHVIGFSLGAHVGNYLALSLEPYKIPRITGLDPAMPLFIGRENDRKLDKTDALFVDVIHTNAGVQGTVEDTGHVDFYVNGGVNQRGCRDEENPFACDHNRAPEYFAESIGTRVGFMSWSCAGFIEYLLGNCKPKYNMVPMGDKCPNTTRGFYVTYTADVKPFALGPWIGARYKSFVTKRTFNITAAKTNESNTTPPPTVQIL